MHRQIYSVELHFQAEEWLIAMTMSYIESVSSYKKILGVYVKISGMIIYAGIILVDMNVLG